MTSRYLLGTAFLCLAACGDDAREAIPDAETAPEATTEAIVVPAERASVPEAPAPPETPPAVVSDVLGAFEGEVAGLALYEHPVMSFAGAVLAANGPAGLAVVPVDREVEGRVIEGTFDGPVAVGYTDELTFAAAASGGEVVLFTVGEDRGFTPIGSVTADAEALCLIGDALLVVGAEATGYVIGPEGAAEPAFTREGGAGAACAVTDERFFVAVPGKPLRSFDVAGGTPMVDDDYAGLSLEALAAASTEGGPALVTLVGDTVAVDGPGVGRIDVTVRRDGAPVTQVSALAAGSGNFGSLYRDGVVAMVAGGELVLLPWAGVARAAGLEGTSTLSLRPEGPVMPQPEIRLDLPEIETTLGPSAEPGEAP